MSAANFPLAFSRMAKKGDSAVTDQINFRLKRATIERMESYRERHTLHPTLTQIVEAAVAMFLDAEEPSLSLKPKK